MGYKMFNLDKVQKAYMNALLKSDRTFFGVDDQEKGKSYISDGHFVAIIPRNLCVVRCDMPDGRHITPDAFRKYTEGAGDLQQAHDTMERRTLPDKKTMVVVLQIGDGETMWINEKYYKYFSDMSVTLWATTPNAPVIVKWGDEVIGVILPIRKEGC